MARSTCFSIALQFLTYSKEFVCFNSARLFSPNFPVRLQHACYTVPESAEISAGGSFGERFARIILYAVEGSGVPEHWFIKKDFSAHAQQGQYKLP